MGSFDGVHAGHRVIIDRLNQLARMAGGCSVLITFHPHPRKVLYPDTAGRDLKLISTLGEKCHLLEEAGLDHLLVLEFTREFARTSSMDFVKEILAGRLKAHTIVVGFNHFFGHNKQGSFESLYRVRDQYGFRVEEIPEQEIQNETVSSTKIRKALQDGHIQRANAYLEHFFMVEGSFMPGEKKENFRCIRITITEEHKLIPPPGFYAVYFKVRRDEGKGLLKISSEGLKLFPLDKVGLSGDGCGRLYFHKHLDKSRLSGFQDAIFAVEELVY